MDHDQIESLRRTSASWKLLRADNAPLVLSFLQRVFVQDNVRIISASDLIDRLDEELYALNERSGEGTYPKSARAYLDDWSAPECGWLRKFYPPASDEPHFDMTPAVEKALSWLESLLSRSFVGTESRLNTVFDLLRQLAFGTESDPDLRLADLSRRREELDAEIDRVRSGTLSLMDPVSQRDRYQQFTSTARELLADFREVEANFRTLDRELRAQIAGWTGSKGELLDDMLGDRNAISDSDQGKSFHAFYDFLLSHQKQEEFTTLLGRVQALPAIGEPDPRMRTIHYDWLDAGERTQVTVRLLSEQLRRFLDDQVWLENRRVMDILRSIESTALKLHEHPAVALSTDIDATAPAPVLPMERPLYSPPTSTPLNSAEITAGDDNLDPSVLFEQVYVDSARLSSSVRRSLQQQQQVGLVQVIGDQPLEHGLAELVGYFSLTDDAFETVFDEASRDRLTWQDAEGNRRVATVPRVTYTRKGAQP